ncbi:OLC1v1022667C1 [Oldenlandia corymbosa var. corymbosa]|uniref:OLC1v1022667C1 n=1 Tax=Oldenlandia corymbosa var. corymbosa TaxID=529605 RepID=A0AAV1C0Y8_OLDCO|nr:OLC1v1022667C1 [Oldenlandia corymbosa var. corymbosa]
MASSNSSSTIMTTSFGFMISLAFIFAFKLSEAQSSVPAVYVLGDSLMDVGNNNHIQGSVLKANYPYNGVDYTDHKPTGRFSNGKNTADLIAEKVGVPTSPPYLSNTNDVFLQGVSFASGGSGLFNSTGQGFLKKTISLSAQVDYYTTVHHRLVQQLGADGAQQHLSKSIFVVVIGSNDVFAYFEDDDIKNSKTPDQYTHEMITILQGLITQLHSMGARKLVVSGLPMLGCTPAQRFGSSTEDCNSDMNNMASSYNQKLSSMLSGLQSSFNDISYSYIDTFAVLNDIIENAANYEGQSVPAIYILGDSLMDVGNNNYINGSLLKANYPYNGIDYPGGKPTGRFCNGKNSADFFADKVGLPTAPPYLSNTGDVFLKGVSFASGGSGLFNSTGQGLLRKTLSLTQQVDYYSMVHDRLVQQLGAAGAQQHLSRSLFVIVIGSNDVFAYFDNGNNRNGKNKVTPDQYVDQMITILQGLVQKLHSLGARKFVVIGLASLGCTPAQRFNSNTEDCNSDMNTMAIKYNQKLTAMLSGLQSNLHDINYTYFDTYPVLYDIIQNPANYGFAEVKAACCGLGKLNAGAFCTPLAVYCPNRTDHLFWDKVHPTQQAASILVNTIYSGSPPHVTPMNVQQLIAL